MMTERAIVIVGSVVFALILGALSAADCASRRATSDVTVHP